MGMYFIYHQQKEEGPFKLEFIEAMVFAGVYPAETPIRPEEGADWQPFSSVSTTRLQAARPPASRSSASGQGKKESNVTPVGWAVMIGVGALAITGLVVFLKDKTVPATKPIAIAPPVPPKPIDVGRDVTTTTVLEPGPSTTTTLQPTTQPSTRFPISSSSSSRITTALGDAAREAREDSQLYRDASGRTYRVPHAAYLRLLGMKAALDTKLREIEADDQRMSVTKSRLEAADATLNNRNKVAVDEYNRSVDNYNQLLREARSKNDAYNREVDAFNAELERVGTLIR